MLFYVFKGFEKRGAKIVFLFQEGVLVCQNIVSFWQNISVPFYKLARRAADYGCKMSPSSSARVVSCIRKERLNRGIGILS